MTLLFSQAIQLSVTEAEFVAQPSITRWQRLEAEIAALDLAPGLEARIADPLWLVGRQWQLAELRGEDAGTPIHVALEGESAPVQFPQDSPRGGEPFASRDGLVEPVVEAEAARDECPSLALQAGLDFERALALHGAKAMIPKFRTKFPFTPPKSFDGAVDPAGAQLLALSAGRSIDGRALAAAFQNALNAAGAVKSLPSGITTTTSTQKAAALRAANEWLSAWSALRFEPAGASLWKDRRLEYVFGLESPSSKGTTSLLAQEYHGGRLDWWTFDLGATTGAAAAGASVSVKMLPVPIRFPGMPANRYWECEDGSVNLARPKGGPASISLMLMLEYALVASNDWFHVPLELNYGTGFRVNSLRVTDTFGRVSEVKRASEADPSGWALFELSPARDASASSQLFILPSVAANVLESSPLEETVMFRDEMANLVWGVERKTPGFTAEALERNDPAANSQVMSQQMEDLAEVDAATVYRLQSTVALNWYPFAAKQDPDSPPGTVLLSRKNLRRVSVAPDGAVTESITRPKGRILNGHEAHFEVEEREVPRSGLFITRTLQLARTADGRTIVWLGRQKRVGRGEGRSDLRYDLLEPTDEK